jgi:hypothetical protein
MEAVFVCTLLLGGRASLGVGIGGGGAGSETLVSSSFGGGEISSSEDYSRSGSEPEEDSEEPDEDSEECSLSASDSSASLSSCVVKIVGT